MPRFHWTPEEQAALRRIEDEARTPAGVRAIMAREQERAELRCERHLLVDALHELAAAAEAAAINGLVGEHQDPARQRRLESLDAALAAARVVLDQGGPTAQLKRREEKVREIQEYVRAELDAERDTKPENFPLRWVATTEAHDWVLEKLGSVAEVQRACQLDASKGMERAEALEALRAVAVKTAAPRAELATPPAAEVYVLTALAADRWVSVWCTDHDERTAAANALVGRGLARVIDKKPTASGDGPVGAWELAPGVRERILRLGAEAVLASGLRPAGGK